MKKLDMGGWLLIYAVGQVPEARANSMACLKSYYRICGLVFGGFGESGKKRDTYSIQNIVVLANQFMDRLGIEVAVRVEQILL
jgi:hypothetical protein